MADPVLTKPDPEAFTKLMRSQALALHAGDQPPGIRREWEQRRTKLRAAMFQAMGPFPEKPCALEPKTVGVIDRHGYRIEKLLIQSRPDMWITASAYVPQSASGKVPAVLVVHGHWPWARRDPVVQARCLGLVKLGFFVLAVDAFGAGERYPSPARGTYHGALFGSTLWPVGQTLLGMQVYDNRRAVDYLRQRPEVDGDLLGITGASGGGNQSMYAGSLDERFRAVVPVCSVGTYQSYLHAACCVCEVLPGALRFAEEGDVLSLVAPRALLVINATRDGFQFSVGEAEKSIARACKVFRLYGVDDKLHHAVFESGHDYSQAMREVMYGWMTRWLKKEGEGKPIPEPKHTLETPEDLACFGSSPRPKGFLFPPAFAAREARLLVAKLTARRPDHVEEWESAASYSRNRLRHEVLGEFPEPPRPSARSARTETFAGVTTAGLIFQTELEMPLPALMRTKPAGTERQPACILLHLEGKTEALKHPLAGALVDGGWAVLAPDLRATGETRPANDAIAGAPDHNSAEHALWLGRPLLGQWVFDVSCLIDWLIMQPTIDTRKLALVGLGQAGLVALCAGAVLDDRVTSVATLGSPTSLITEQAYPNGTYMGLLAPGILRYADIPQLAALIAPRRLTLADGITSAGNKLTEKGQKEAYDFAGHVYRLHKAEIRLTVVEGASPISLAARI